MPIGRDLRARPKRDGPEVRKTRLSNVQACRCSGAGVDVGQQAANSLSSQNRAADPRSDPRRERRSRLKEERQPFDFRIEQRHSVGESVA